MFSVQRSTQYKSMWLTRKAKQRKYREEKDEKKEEEKKEEDSDRQAADNQEMSISPPADRNAVMADTVPCMVWSELIVTFLYWVWINPF